MLNVVFKSRFKKDLKRLKSSNRDEDELLVVIDVLAHEQPLEEKFRDHSLVGTTMPVVVNVISDQTGC